MTRENNVVYFFRDVRGEPVLSKELLRQRTDQYQGWVENYATKNRIPIEWAEKDVRKKDWLAPSCRARQKAGRFGVYFILRSMEQGPTFAIRHPKYPTKDPNYRILRKQRSRYTHYYFFTSTFSIRSPDRCSCASPRSCPFTSPAISTATISWNAN